LENTKDVSKNSRENSEWSEISLGCKLKLEALKMITWEMLPSCVNLMHFIKKYEL